MFYKFMCFYVNEIEIKTKKTINAEKMEFLFVVK